MEHVPDMTKNNYYETDLIPKTLDRLKIFLFWYSVWLVWDILI